MTTGLELYEALKPHVGEDAARMMAEALPLTDRIATKADLDGSLKNLSTEIDAKLSGMEARMFRWMLGFFATLWVSNVGIIVTLLVKL